MSERLEDGIGGLRRVVERLGNADLLQEGVGLDPWLLTKNCIKNCLTIPITSG